MKHVPCRDRRFSLWLSDVFGYHYTIHLAWLQQFVIRLGPVCARTLWEAAFEKLDVELMDRILAAGWEETGENRSAEVAAEVEESLDRLFPAAVDGFGRAQARTVLDGTPPFRQMVHALPCLDLVRESSTYEALHLFRHGLALLAEEVIRRYGKEGELIVYDAMLEELHGIRRRTDVKTFLKNRHARFTTETTEADIFSAGLEVEMVRASDNEVVTRVLECEWARYFRERHPAVGYLLACSLDNAAYRSFNQRIRLQRTTNLMEGGDHCDFRVYALPEAFGEQP